MKPSCLAVLLLLCSAALSEGGELSGRISVADDVVRVNGVRVFDADHQIAPIWSGRSLTLSRELARWHGAPVTLRGRYVQNAAGRTRSFALEQIVVPQWVSLPVEAEPGGTLRSSSEDVLIPDGRWRDRLMQSQWQGRPFRANGWRYPNGNTDLLWVHVLELDRWAFEPEQLVETIELRPMVAGLDGDRVEWRRAEGDYLSVWGPIRFLELVEGHPVTVLGFVQDVALAGQLQLPQPRLMITRVLDPAPAVVVLRGRLDPGGGHLEVDGESWRIELPSSSYSDRDGDQRRRLAGLLRQEAGREVKVRAIAFRARKYLLVLDLEGATSHGPPFTETSPASRDEGEGSLIEGLRGAGS